MNFTEIILRKLQECPLLEEHGIAALGFAGMDAKKRSMSVLNTKGELTVGLNARRPFRFLLRPALKAGRFRFAKPQKAGGRSPV